MKSVGEAMGIGRTFTEAFLMAMRSWELDAAAATPWQRLDELPDGVHPWFHEQLEEARALLRSGRSPTGPRISPPPTNGEEVAELLELKRTGWADADIAEQWGTTEEAIRARRHELGIRPAYRRVDSCAAEVEASSNYLYSTWGELDDPPSPGPERPVAVILGSGPNRIGQGIEFDYCCVHAARTYEALGCTTVMVNCNPETVSTDYDTSDRLYFEPLGTEEVLEICAREQPAGVVIQFGGQTPLKLARSLEAAGHRILGTPFDAVDLAEDRERFAGLCEELGLGVPEWGIARDPAEAAAIAERIGYPVLVRPSYVLGGRSMRVCYTRSDIPDDGSLHGATILVDRFLEGALEIDVDALCDGEEVYVAAIMQHVEEAGVHSGDSSCVLPATSLTADELEAVSRAVRRLAPALGVIGLVNVQLALADGRVFVLEANPRASRTVPFASKAIGINLVEMACRISTGERIADLGLPPEGTAAQVSVKAAVFPFSRFPGADPLLGPEMRSTGEVMASGADFATAFAKAERAAGRELPAGGVAFVSVRDADKQAATGLAGRLVELGFVVHATSGTARALSAAGLPVTPVRKVGEEGSSPTVVDLIRRGRCDLVVNTPQGRGARSDGYLIRDAALVARIPCITTLAVAEAAVEAIARARDEGALSLQERVERCTA
jgi:carbamoyl-phosphate synthase large subunit